MSVTVAALTTTFTPGPSCSNLGFSAPSYSIWLQDPVPTSGVTMSDCYPKEWLAGYGVAPGPTSSFAPFMTKLICPSGWTTAFRPSSSSYIACCPTNYDFHPPDSTVNTDRPGFGGTCFSDFTAGQTLTVTQYGSPAIQTQTIPFSTAGQAYAHPIDGIMYRAAVQTAAPSLDPSLGLALDTVGAPPPQDPATASQPNPGFLPASATAAPSSTSPVSGSSSSADHSLSSGTIIAIAVSAAGGFVLIAGLFLLLCLRRRTHNVRCAEALPPPTPMKDAFLSSTASSVNRSPLVCADRGAANMAALRSPHPQKHIAAVYHPHPQRPALQPQPLKPLIEDVPVQFSELPSENESSRAPPPQYQYQPPPRQDLRSISPKTVAFEIYSPTRASRDAMAQEMARELERNHAAERARRKTSEVAAERVRRATSEMAAEIETARRRREQKREQKRGWNQEAELDLGRSSEELELEDEEQEEQQQEQRQEHDPMPEELEDVLEEEEEVENPFSPRVPVSPSVYDDRNRDRATMGAVSPSVYPTDSLYWSRGSSRRVSQVERERRIWEGGEDEESRPF